MLIDLSGEAYNSLACNRKFNSRSLSESQTRFRTRRKGPRVRAFAYSNEYVFRNRERLVLWPHENVLFGNVALASWPAVAWASRPTFTHWIEHLHPVTDLVAESKKLDWRCYRAGSAVHIGRSDRSSAIDSGISALSVWAESKPQILLMTCALKDGNGTAPLKCATSPSIQPQPNEQVPTELVRFQHPNRI